MNKRKVNTKKLCKILKIVGFCSFIVSIVFLVLGVVFLVRHDLVPGFSLLFVGILLVAISSCMVAVGFTPNFSNYTIKSTHYIEDISKEDFEKMMSSKEQAVNNSTSDFFSKENVFVNIAEKKLIQILSFVAIVAKNNNFLCFYFSNY